ncbi:hypothetical protein [Streptomyces sp. NBC_00728]|uniref:hypothetical protein n=1 Tax=Streptomyces sp. NBC_00728 TaxID=2903676 RepID=UPI00386CB295
MRISPGLLLRRAIVGCPALATSRAPGGPASAEAPTDRASVAQAANREERVVPPGRLDLPENVRGGVGPVAYNGAGGHEGDSPSVSTDRDAPTPLGDAANPRRDALNSTIAEPGPRATKRVPADANTLGHDSDVLELGKGIRHGGDQLAFRIVSQRDAAWVGALFAAVDAKQ